MNYYFVYFGEKVVWKVKNFNPSGSMDYFGSGRGCYVWPAQNKFQSFWFNGLLWKCFRKNWTPNSFWFQSFWFNGLLWKIRQFEFWALFFEFQSFWFNGLLWKTPTDKFTDSKMWVSILLVQWITLEVSGSYVSITKERSSFNPSGSMDYFGRIEQEECMLVAWNCFNPSGSMDYFGSFCLAAFLQIIPKVSILLVQWITLEVFTASSFRASKLGFNPSGSMDYFGRPFCFVKNFRTDRVSILLVQWITLEDLKYILTTLFELCFNPSGSMDYFGSLPKVQFFHCFFMFQSFWFNGLLWKKLWANRFQIDILFQSFWFNGLLWKSFRIFWSRKGKQVSILLVQWITLEAGKMCWGITGAVMFQSFWFNGLLWKSTTLLAARA